MTTDSQFGMIRGHGSLFRGDDAIIEFLTRGAKYDGAVDLSPLCGQGCNHSSFAPIFTRSSNLGGLRPSGCAARPAARARKRPLPGSASTLPCSTNTTPVPM